jgi:hypothetical protein
MPTYDETLADSMDAGSPAVPLLTANNTLSAAMDTVFDQDYHVAIHTALTSTGASALGLVGNVAPTITEAMAMADVLSGRMTAQAASADEMDMSDGIVLVLQAIASDTMAATSPVLAVLNKLEALTETLVMTGAAASSLEAMETIAEALLVEDLARSGFSVSALSTADAEDVITGRLQAIVSALSTVAMSASTVPTVRITALVDDGMDAAVTLGTSARLFAAITEGLVMRMSLSLGAEDYTAYALSICTRDVDGALIPAVVEYQNFPFNSFAQYDGKYYGANDEGIFELTGGDDNGTEIAAYVRSALNTLGTNRYKSMPSMYLGYTSSSTLVLKVVTVANGAKVEDWYTLREKPADVMRDARIKVGKGLKSVYWAWELHNKDGGDFALDVVELMPLALERRIKDGN